MTTNEIKNFKVTPWHHDELLLSQPQTYPVYLQKGEKLRWNITASKPISVQVCNADSRSVLKTYKGKSIVQDSLIVENSAIYFIDINPMGTQYIEFEINYKVNDMSHLGNATPIKVEQVMVDRGEIVIYDLNGMRIIDVQELKRGVYIVNGKKQFVK